MESEDVRRLNVHVRAEVKLGRAPWKLLRDDGDGDGDCCSIELLMVADNSLGTANELMRGFVSRPALGVHSGWSL
jgi:hypothetical protein